MRIYLRSKIHKATITNANLHYVGSITIDERLMNLAELNEFEKVLVVDNTNGPSYRQNNNQQQSAYDGQANNHSLTHISLLALFH